MESLILTAPLQLPTEVLPPSLWPIDTPPSPGLDLNVNEGPRVIGVSAFLLAISGIIVSLRFVARYLSTAGIWWDDWLCLAAMLVSWGCCIMGFIAPSNNFGRHEAAQAPADAITDTMEFFQMLYAYQTLYTIAVTLAKASIIVFYGRIFTERSFKRALWIVSGLVAIWYLTVQIIQLTECRPLHALWDGSYEENCIDLVQLFVVSGAFNCIINFILLVMPLPMIWSLEIGRKAKLGLSFTFLLGVFVFAVSLARLIIARQIVNVDVTYTYVDVAIWTAVEPNIAVCSASLPILRSLWVLLRPSSSAQSSARLRREGGRKYEKQMNFDDAFDSPPQPTYHAYNGAFAYELPVVRSPAPVKYVPPTPVPPSAPPVPPVPQKYNNLSVQNAIEMTRSHTIRSEISDIISPISERSVRKSTIFGEPQESYIPSDDLSRNVSRNASADRARSLIRNVSRNTSAERARGLISKFSPMATTPVPPSGGASPMTDRSESPQTVEMNRLPIQGGGSGGDDDDNDDDHGDDHGGNPDYDVETIRTTRRGRWSEANTLDHSSRRTSRGRGVALKHMSASRRSSQTRADSDSPREARSRTNSQLNRLHAVELDAREDRRFSLKRSR